METKYNFIERTQKILEQYDSFNLPEKENFDVTLLLNCCVGLLFVAKEKVASFLRRNKENLIDWHIDEKKIKVIKNHNLKDEEKSLFNVCKHLRNSIAHYHFRAYHEGDGKAIINRIEFTDFQGEGETPEKQTFLYTSSVEDFRDFLKKLSSETAAKA